MRPGRIALLAAMASGPFALVGEVSVFDDAVHLTTLGHRAVADDLHRFLIGARPVEPPGAAATR